MKGVKGSYSITLPLECLVTNNNNNNNIIEEGKLAINSNLPSGCNTKFYCITGQDGSGKTTLRNSLAEYFAKEGNCVITSKSPCDKHLVRLLNNAISQNGYHDRYTEQLLFSFADGLLSNYMQQLNGHCDYFICQRGPIDQYAHGVTRSGYSFEEIYAVQRPDRLYKFDAYIHLNAEPDVAWERLKADDDKDRYEYPEYFKRQSPATKKLYEEIVRGENKSLQTFLHARHFYLDTTNLKTDEVLVIVLDWLKKLG